MSIVIESVAVTVRDTATDEMVEYRGNLASVIEQARRSADASTAAPAPDPAAGRRKPDREDSRSSAKPKPKADAKKGDAKRVEAKKAEPEPPRSEAPKSKKTKGPRKPSELKWSPVQDGRYHGVAAPSGSGSFRILRTLGTQWALFFVWQNKQWKMLGCHLKLEDAQGHAEREHRKGMPARHDITADVLAQACPIPEGMRDEDIEPAAATAPATPKAAAAPSAPKAAPTPKPRGAEKAEAEQDKELLNSFAAELDSVLDEDDDD